MQSYDMNGNTQTTVNSSGTTTYTWDYDSFGNLTASTGSITNAFRYTGREFDAETGLYYYRARYYDASAGRFTSEDPVGFVGGVNFYDYTENSPETFFDPIGLSRRDVDNIKNTFQNTIDNMVRQGKRRPGTGRVRGWINDLQSHFGNKQACGDQAETLKQQLQRGNYDTNWHFKVARIDNYWGWGVIAWSDDPKDPELLMNPWKGDVQTGPGVWNQLNEWDFNQP